MQLHVRRITWGTRLAHAAACVQDHLVRETALTALLAAYEVEENVSPLHAFTTRFQSRFAELVYDRDEAVAVKGIQLVTLLVKAGEMPQEQVRTCSRASSALMAHLMMQLWPVGRSGQARAGTEAPWLMTGIFKAKHMSTVLGGM